jgi:O-antigen ligase
VPSALRPEPSVVAAPAGRGCENLGVPAASRLGRWGSATAFGAIAASIGVLAGIDPRFAIAAALSLGLLLVMLADLYVGLLVFVVLNFAAQVPSVAGPGLSVVKIAGLMLAISWLANVATRQEATSQFRSAQPALTYVLVLFLSWIALSQIWAESSGEALAAFSRLALDAILFLIVFTTVRTPNQMIGVVAAFVAGACIDALYGLLSTPAATEDPSRLTGSIDDPNGLATVLMAALALSLGLAAALRRMPLARMAVIGVATLCAAAIFLTGSRSGLIALGVALAAFIVVGSRWRGRILVLALVLAVAGVGYYKYVASPGLRSHVSTVGSGESRLDLWTVGWRMVQKHPVEGVGAGNFPVSSVHYLLEPGAIARSDSFVGTPQVAHNTYLELWAELGLVGLLLFLSMVGLCLRSALRAARVFARQGDIRMEMIARALFVALAGFLAAAFFVSREYAKDGWLLLGLAPAVLAIARSRDGPATN